MFLTACSEKGQAADTVIPAPASASATSSVSGSTGGPSAANGLALFGQCATCHTYKAGERNRIGPNLHGVYGSPAAGVPGFAYSRALRASGLMWDDETLDAYLDSPQRLVPGNRMGFAGMKVESERADMIAFLKTLSD